jgi:hypothetical protein
MTSVLIEALAECPTMAKALREVGQKHAGVSAMLGKAVAEFLRKKRFFAPSLGVEREPCDGYRKQAAQFAQSNRGAE